jgi:hypothetical protein
MQGMETASAPPFLEISDLPKTGEHTTRFDFIDDRDDKANVNDDVIPPPWPSGTQARFISLMTPPKLTQPARSIGSSSDTVERVCPGTARQMVEGLKFSSPSAVVEAQHPLTKLFQSEHRKREWRNKEPYRERQWRCAESSVPHGSVANEKDQQNFQANPCR